MSTNIIPFGNPGAEVPAHLATLFTEDSANIGAKQTINTLSYRGKTFRVVVDGNETPITSEVDGVRIPVPVVNVVVLDHNKNRSRAFYEGEFEEGKNQAPKCFSGDGVTPDTTVKEPCSSTCATCPHSVKGSKITPQGKQTTACAPYKRLAIMPSNSLLRPQSHVPLLLRLAQTSVWDKDNKRESEGWYAWDQYLDMLRARGAKHTAAVETRVTFDLDVAYPKLLFSASRWLSPEESAAVIAKIKADADAISGVINGKQSEDGMTGIQPSPSVPAAQPIPDPAALAAAQAAAAEAQRQEAAAAQAAAQAAAKAAAQAAETERQRKLAELQRQMAELNGTPAPPPATQPAGLAAMADAFGTTATTAAPAPAPTPTASVGGAPAEVIESGTPASLKGLLDQWDA